ncbi:hypothetical protein T11_13407 [Trichinella zimbabwensis]|uniref:Uncharacterized protein n=1 Tax=Trichinella zimbabwensis TaxID=268475 RepID=A0A0V1HK51_9BILA|nr:hypothetical protein T11_13407 [Trichinella zimbabwensis]
MADVSELRFVTNCCGGISLVTRRGAKKGSISTNLDVTAVLRQTPHMEACPVDQHLIYDEEAASAEPSTFGHFPIFKRVLSRDPIAGYSRRVNRSYTEKQRRALIYTGEHTSGRRTFEQYLEALMYLTPELI